jgi:hypothetical protein
MLEFALAVADEAREELGRGVGIVAAHVFLLVVSGVTGAFSCRVTHAARGVSAGWRVSAAASAWRSHPLMQRGHWPGVRRSALGTPHGTHRCRLTVALWLMRRPP